MHKVVDRMRRKRNNSGFTMAEMLIVVAIIAVLGGVTFIAVQSHQRSLAQLERNTIAKELFFAAQNHLTMAESQGYLGVEESKYGTPEDTDKKVYYIICNGAPEQGTMLDLMLPFGAIDESVRSGGSYLIRYQPHPATILDVFYCSRSGKPERFNHTISEGEYSTFLGYRIKQDDGSYKANLPSSGYVVGWYGGGEAVDTGIYLNTPEVEIINGEKLIVKVTDNNVLYPIPMPGDSNKNVKASLEIIISGELVKTKGNDGTVISSKTAKAVIVLDNPDNENFNRSDRVSDDGKGVYTIVLDDITTPTINGDGMHFADLNQYATGNPSKIWFMADPETETKTLFRPGENITVEAVTFSNSMLTNIAYSGAKMANSLFADTVVESGATATFDPTKVRIANFRHLENLDKKVSGLEVEVTTADQIVDLGKLPEAGDGGSDGEEDEDDEESEEDTDLTSTGAGTTPAAEKDLSWTGFKQAINPTTPENVQVYIRSETAQTVQDGTAKGCYYPISPDYALIYNGNGHSITNVVVAEAVDAGLFGAPKQKLEVKDLTLVDFNISGFGNAGALAGTLSANSTAT
ncbi:MAG: type II secretion system protein, partial [Clostridia bacterium]|nr:type II secretion system protein [Clostridia bacterium]